MKFNGDLVIDETERHSRAQCDYKIYKLPYHDLVRTLTINLSRLVLKTLKPRE